jgi:hypothetical protein
MSLEEILRSPDGFSTWRTQRKRLLQVGMGLLVLVLGLSLAAVSFLSSKSHLDSQIRDSRSATDATSLAYLMKIQQNAKLLQKDVNHLRGVAIADSPRRSAHSLPPVTAPIANYDPGEGFATLQQEKSEIYIPTGAVFKASLITPIKTSLQKTFVMAETTHEFRMDAKRKIPKRSQLIGNSRFDPVLKGVVVEFQTLVFPNGIESSLNGLALSRNALPELEGLYFSDRLATYGTALAFGFLSGFSDAAREREPTPFGSQPSISVGNQLLGGLSTASFQVANQMLQDIKENSVEYVVVPAGEQIFVVLTQRYRMGGLN